MSDRKYRIIKNSSILNIFILILILSTSILFTTCSVTGEEGESNGADTTAPTVTITSIESTITAVSPFSITITFSEVVTGR